MELAAQELRDLIRSTLDYLDVHSDAAENLLLSRAAQAAKHSPSQAHGLFAIDAATHRLVWDKYLAFKPDLASRIRGLASQHAFLSDPHLELSINLRYATAIAWAIHLAFPEVREQAQTA